MRMFVAVWPDAATCGVLADLRLEPAGALRLVRPSQWHVTLRFLGEVDEGLTPVLVEALVAAARRLPDSIPCHLGPGLAWFGGDRVLQVPVGGLEGAAAAVGAATLPLVPDPVGGRFGFSGHLTLARTTRQSLTPPERTALTALACTASFEVDSFDLVASRPSEHGRRYETLARVPLGA
ncbi:MAG TPA: 2'-5' RNA ligase family protein [Acidimicrobiales bacterium]|nr:2'-5' RNA ligase family protein [Acidimicrobiales bacterium]